MILAGEYRNIQRETSSKVTFFHHMYLVDIAVHNNVWWIMLHFLQKVWIL